MWKHQIYLTVLFSKDFSNRLFLMCFRDVLYSLSAHLTMSSCTFCGTFFWPISFYLSLHIKTIFGRGSQKQQSYIMLYRLHAYNTIQMSIKAAFIRSKIHKTLIQSNIITIWKNCFLFYNILKCRLIYSCDAQLNLLQSSVTWSSEIILINWFKLKKHFW